MRMLDGVRLLSFNHFLMGPLGVQILADLGADVVAVEALDGAFQRQWSGNNAYVGDELLLFVANRNKRSLALDLRSDKGREIAQKLIAASDIVAENFRPGVMDRLGLGFEEARRINPKIIYASASDTVRTDLIATDRGRIFWFRPCRSRGRHGPQSRWRQGHWRICRRPSRRCLVCRRYARGAPSPARNRGRMPCRCQFAGSGSRPPEREPDMLFRYGPRPTSTANPAISADGTCRGLTASILQKTGTSRFRFAR